MQRKTRKRAKSSPALEGMALELRSLYLQRWRMHRRVMRESADLDDVGDDKKLAARWDGGQDSRGARWEPVWPRLAATAEAQELNPRNWLDALFSMVYLFDHIPWPTDLENPKVLQRAHNWKPHCELDLFFMLQTELQTLLREQWEREQQGGLPAVTSRMLVCDPNLDVSALPRYALAVKNAQLDLAEKLEVAAVLQYRFSPSVCMRALGSWFPAAIKDAAARLAAEEES